MPFPSRGCGNCGNGSQCIQCVPVEVFSTFGNIITPQPLFLITVPAGTWKDGEMFVVDYALDQTIGGTNGVPRTRFTPFVVAGDAPPGTQISSNWFYGGQSHNIQLYRMIFRRIGSLLAIYDGDRAAYKVVAGVYPDSIGFNSIFQAQVGSGAAGPQDYQSATAAYPGAPDFTNDIDLSLMVVTNGINVADTIVAMSPAAYKYTVPA